ncbi:hypothetical protein DICA0_E28018 [Diutina catenulata]
MGEKRTKPCSNCKQSKVRCIYTDSLPCQRCIKTGRERLCQFSAKLPSLFDQIDGGFHAGVPPVPICPNPPGIFGQFSHSSLLPSSHEAADSRRNKINLAPLTSSSQVSSLQQNPIPDQASLTQLTRAMSRSPEEKFTKDDADSQWKNAMENKINSFDSKLDDLVEVLKNQQRELNRQSASSSGSLQPPSPISSTKRLLNDAEPHEFMVKHRRLDLPSDFRRGFLSMEEAHELFSFFNANIAQQLFGFEIASISLKLVWNSCPLLVCAICTISSIHHPRLSTKSSQLQVYLNRLCGDILFKGKPTSVEDGFNTVMALVLCSFWLSNSQMFTGLALQLAKECGLDKDRDKKHLKLWYLLYVLDGQQSMSFNRQPLIDGREYTLTHSRELLGNKPRELEAWTPSSGEPIKEGNRYQNTEDRVTTTDQSAPVREYAMPKGTATFGAPMSQPSKLTDLRLVSQVEYNQALSEAFRGNAWDLLAPSQFGIPSKSNLELDKWMVSWTVLLAPGNHGAVWSSKSTLIYYNFAKMSINSRALRQIQLNPTDDNLANFHADDDPDFLANNTISSDEAVVSANLAVSAAQTVLSLVVNDPDILDNLRYVPVHIHIMLYYAALLLVNPPEHSSDTSETITPTDHITKVLNNLRLIKTLQKKIYLNLPIDINFGNRLIRNIEEIINAKLAELKKEVERLDSAELKEQVNALFELNRSNIYEVNVESDTSSRGSTSPGPEKISAWPGRDHGHP